MTSFDSPIIFTTQDKPKLTMKNKRRATVYFPVLQLEWVKELKNKAGVTVNDVLLACTAGAIRRYCASKEDPLFVGSSGSSSAAGKPVLCRALMPVAFPRSQKDLDNPARAMRNYFAMISVPLPMSEASSKKRLEACASTTRQLKSSPLALIQLVSAALTSFDAPREVALCLTPLPVLRCLLLSSSWCRTTCSRWRRTSWPSRRRRTCSVGTPW
jgi:hypothetical protein